MAYIYENYVWRLVNSDLAVDIELPQDLSWIDRDSWNPIRAKVDEGLDGSQFIQLSSRQFGRPITLAGKEDMAWVEGSLINTLREVRDHFSSVSQLSFLEKLSNGYGPALFQFNVLFNNQVEKNIDVEPVKGFDEFDPDGWFRVISFSFITVSDRIFNGCSSNKVLTVSNINGTFTVGENLTTSSGVSKLLNIDGTTFSIYLLTGTINTGETITGSISGATADIDSIA